MTTDRPGFPIQYALVGIALLFVVLFAGYYSSDLSLTSGVAATNKGTVTKVNAMQNSDFAEPTTFMIRSCTWSPSAQEACMEALAARICAAYRGREASALGRRFLMFGDSTTSHLLIQVREWLINGPRDIINNACPNRYICETHIGERCRNNVLMGLEYPVNETWSMPNHSQGEGPVLFGLTLPFCNDCKGCSPHYTVCSVKDTSSLPCTLEHIENKTHGQMLVYGGFLTSEFTRDVAVQSPLFRTSQENLAVTVENSFNTPALLQDWGGRPICMLSAAHHDAAIPNNTQEIYLRNVEWFINIMQAQCQFIIWLGATIPRGDPWRPQTQNGTRAWNAAVRAMIDANNDLNAVFVDVANASQFEGNRIDNIHMDVNWNVALTSFLHTALTATC